LTAGREYEPEVLQAQPELVESTAVINIVLDGKVLQSIGPADLTLIAQGALGQGFHDVDGAP
jgi:hypothetical protein